MSIQQRIEAMERAHQIMNTVGLRHWLFNGALLGIYRDGNLIKHDDDVDFCTKWELLKPVFDELVSALIKDGFRVIAKKHKKKMSAFLNDTKVAISGYKRFANKRERESGLNFPASMMEFDGAIKFHGQEYQCLWPIEDFLKWAYKDWRTPDASKDEKDYNNARFLGN